MARFLIIGGSGYVGSRFAERLLRAGHHVRGLVRDSERDDVERLAGLGMVVWQADITQPESLIGVANGIDHVYNLTSRSPLDNGAARRVLVEGNRNLIAACSRARSVRSYIFLSNTTPYGDRGDEWLTEDSSVAPTHPFGEATAEAEQLIMGMVRQHNFPAIILRTGAIYGPGRDPVESVISGTATLIGDGRNFVSRIHIDDLLVVLDRVAADGQPGAIYNVADDEPLRAAECYGEVRRRLGMVPPRTFPRDSALFAGLDPSIVGMASSSTRISNARIKDELGISLRYPSLLDWLEERLPEPALAEVAV